MHSQRYRPIELIGRIATEFDRTQSGKDNVLVIFLPKEVLTEICPSSTVFCPKYISSAQRNHRVPAYCRPENYQYLWKVFISYYPYFLVGRTLMILCLDNRNITAVFALNSLFFFRFNKLRCFFSTASGDARIAAQSSIAFQMSSVPILPHSRNHSLSRHGLETH